MLVSMSKSNPSTTALPNGLGLPASTHDCGADEPSGPKAPQRNSAKYSASAVVARV